MIAVVMPCVCRLFNYNMWSSHLLLYIFHTFGKCFWSLAESSQRLQQLWPRVPQWEATAVPQRQELHRLHGSERFRWLLFHQRQNGAAYGEVTNAPLHTVCIAVLLKPSNRKEPPMTLRVYERNHMDPQAEASIGYGSCRALVPGDCAS